MLKNILKTAVRNILRDKAYSLLNLIGLSISITASLLLILYIFHELSYEDFHEYRDRIYRIVSHIQERDDEFSWASTQAPLAKQMKDDYPEVEEYVRINGLGSNTMLSYGDKNYAEDKLCLADSTFFKIFSHKFLEGQPNTCLDQPNSIVLSKSLAEKYFGSEQAVGKILKNADGESLKVTAVIEDFPRNTHLEFAGLISLNSIDDLGGGWGSFYLNTYILLKEGIDGEAFKSKLPEVVKKYVSPIFNQFGVKVQYEMQNLSEIHLFSKTDGEQGGGDISYIYIFSIVIVFMLVISAINYMNLATARSENRAREVGIRKVLGSYRWMLILQFFAESLLLVFVSIALSLFAIKFLLLNQFNAMTSREFFFEDLFSTDILLSILAIIIILGLLGGSYPAFYLSSFQPVKVLKGKFVHGRATVPLRKILVILQFVISISMVFSTIIVFEQLSFLKNKDLGFSKDDILVVRFTDAKMSEKYASFRNLLLENSNVLGVASAVTSPGKGYPKNLLPVESKDGFVDKGVNFYRVDEDYIPTLEIDILLGRNFSKDFSSDSSAVIVNQLFAHRMEWENPIGKRIRISEEGEELEYLTVIGVMNDFHQLNLYQELEPLAFFYGENCRNVHIKFNTAHIEEFKLHLDKAWNEIYPNQPLNSYFLDQDFFESYDADRKRSQVFTLFSGITIFIACLGLLGLTSFSAEQKTKEIGIRKVIGASVLSIVFLLTREFFILLIISMSIAFTGSYLLMSSWLDNSFVYHVNISFMSFVFAAFAAIFFVIITVGYQSFKAATNNPIDALRTE